MGIMTRFVRLCKADIHGVIDQLEDKDLLLKQYLRDMEEELAKKEAALKKMVAFREQVQREHERYTEKEQKIEQNITEAIGKENDELARLFIKKLKTLVYHREELSRHVERLNGEIEELVGSLEEQRLQYGHFKVKAAEYSRRRERDQWEKTIPSLIPYSFPREPSEAEVELEILQRREAMKGGAQQ